MPIFAADIECDGLDATKIWCFSLAELDEKCNPIRSWTETDYEEMKSLISNPDNTFIMHNGCSYDKPTLVRLLGVPFLGTIIDSLAVSWYLEQKRLRHGLASHGEELGVPKPEIDDWEGLSLQEYIHRCEEDVKIQRLLWKKQWRHLNLLYDTPEQAMKCVEYLTFKLECAALQEESKWKVHKGDCLELHGELLEDQASSKRDLFSIMPQVPVMGKKARPKKCYKKDGTMSSLGLKWEAFCKEYGISFERGTPYEYQVGWKDPNPGSHQQVKAYLTSLGWEPTIFDHKRIEGGGFRRIPQVKDKDSGKLCPNIVSLFAEHPNLRVLETLSIVSHRITITKSFLANMDDKGFIKAQIQGFTNTLRFKHKVFLNIPSLRKAYGDRIRGLLIARSDDYELCGSDMCSLEDRIKQHYMMPYDPDYVEEMSADGYDPHLAIALEAGMVSADEVAFYKEYKAAH